MKFFDRQEEMAVLRRNRDQAAENARFTVLTGRRRVGKTELIREAYGDRPYLYFYVSRKTEIDLCSDFKAIAEHFLDRTIPGKIERFSSIFRFLLEESARSPLTLVIDEFQDFKNVNESIFSEMARDWDELKRTAKINLVVCGSINRMMALIFEDREAPLYGRNTGRLHLEPFRVSVLKEILGYYHPRYSKDDLLALWTFTGGVARYVELLMDAKAFTCKAMIREIVRSDSSFFDEGKIALVEEFGKDHGTYFSILSAIACGKTSRDQIESVSGCAVSGFLTKLEREYAFISKKQPLFEKSANKNCQYRIDDNFYRFWFRFVFKYNYLIEVKMFDELRTIVERDYEVFSGLALEGYFRWKFIEEHAFSRIGGWWDRKGENEIDLVGENEFTHRLVFYEVKRVAKRIDLEVLKRKGEAFLVKNAEKRGLNISYVALSLEDM